MTKHHNLLRIQIGRKEEARVVGLPLVSLRYNTGHAHMGYRRICTVHEEKKLVMLFFSPRNCSVSL